MSQRYTLDMPPSKYLYSSAQTLRPLPRPDVYSQLPIHVESLVRLDLHLTDTIARRDALVDGGLELVAPRTPPAVAIAVVVAAQEVALGLGAFLDGKGNIDGFEQILLESRVQRDNVVDIALDVLGVQPAQEIAGCLSVGCKKRAVRQHDSQSAVYGVGHSD
jgi:hypothetical protein